MTTTKKPAAKQKYKAECKRCKHVSTRSFSARAALENKKGKNPFSCENCGAKVGYNWLKVVTKA